MGTTLTLAQIVSLISGVVVTGNQSPTANNVRDAINAFGIPEVWRAVLQSTNNNPTSNADIGTPIPAGVTFANVSAHIAAGGWSALKIAAYIDADYLTSNPNVITELMSMKTIALVNGSTTTYAFTSTNAFSSIWDLLYKFKLVYSNTGTAAAPVNGGYTAPTVLSNFLDITDLSTAWKQVGNGSNGVIPDADIGKALELFYVSASAAVYAAGPAAAAVPAVFVPSRLSTFMGYITNTTTPTTAVAYSKTILTLGGAAAAAAPTAAATAASAPWLASLELNALVQYKAICMYKTITNFYDAGFPWEQLVFTNTLIESIKIKYLSATPAAVYAFVGASGTAANGTGVGVPKKTGVAAVTAAPGVAGVALVTAVTGAAVTMVSQIPSIRTTAQIQASGFSLSYLGFYVLYAMGFSGADCVSPNGIRATMVSSAETANDFDLIQNNYIGSYSLLDRLSLLDVVTTGQTPSNILLKGTDSAESIANSILANNGAPSILVVAGFTIPTGGAPSRFMVVQPLTAAASVAYSPASQESLVMAAVRITVVGWSGSNSKSSNTFGAAGFTHNSFIPSDATYTSSSITSYASLYYIDTLNGISTITSRGVITPFNFLSGPAFTSMNTNYIIQSLTGNNPTSILAIQIGSESSIRLSGGSVAGPSNALAQSFLASLSNNSASAGYSYSDILDSAASPAFNSKSAIQVAMEMATTNASKMHSIVSYAKNSTQRASNAKLGFSGLSAADKKSFVSSACKMGILPADLFNLISSDNLDNAQILYDAMSADAGGLAGTITVSAYKQYLTFIGFNDIKTVFVDGGVSGANVKYPVLGKTGSPLATAAMKGAASLIPNEEWFIAFNDAPGIAQLQSIGALPEQLFTWTKDVKVFDANTGILSTPVDRPQSLIYKLAIVKQVYGLSDSQVIDSLEAAGIRAQ
jgi:hypothetical protein